MTKELGLRFLLPGGELKPVCGFQALEKHKGSLWRRRKSTAEVLMNTVEGEDLSASFSKCRCCVYSCGCEGVEGVWDRKRSMRSGPEHLAQRGPLPLCMLAASVGDKVWTREIRSGPANETHAKGLHGNLPSLLHIFFFWSISFHSPLNITSLSSQPSVFVTYLNV